MYALQGFLGRQALPRGTGVCLHRKQQSPPPILGPNPRPPPTAEPLTLDDPGSPVASVPAIAEGVSAGG